MPPKHWELQAEAKKRGIYNFFLPEVCNLKCIEYAPIQVFEYCLLIILF